MNARPWSQGLHDLLAWVAAGRSPHDLPTSGSRRRFAQLLDRALAGGPRSVPPALLVWSRATWGYATTPAGAAALAEWTAAGHQPTPELGLPTTPQPTTTPPSGA